MRKGNLSSPCTSLVQGSRNMKGATAGMGADGDDAGVPTKQIEGVSVGSPKLSTPVKDKVGGSKTASSMGTKIGNAKVSTPSASMKRKY